MHQPTRRSVSLSPSKLRVPFEATMPKKEHAIWCYKQPQNNMFRLGQTAPQRNLVLQAAPISTNHMFPLALTCPQRNTPVGARRSPKITDRGRIDIPHRHPFATWFCDFGSRLSRGGVPPTRPPNLSLRSQTTTRQHVRLAFVIHVT